MKKARLFSHPICHEYTAPRLSFAYLFSIICLILTFIIPFYLCFSPRYALKNNTSISPNTKHNSLNTQSAIATPVGVWLKHDTYREQPKVQFQYKVIFVAQAEEKKVLQHYGKEEESIIIPKEIYYSTIDALNEGRQGTYRSASTTSREADDNLDGITDRLLMKLKLPLEQNEYIHGIQALVFVTYRLETHVKMEMESLVYVHHESGLPGSKFSSVGDLQLRQMTPIPIIKSNQGKRNNEDDILNLFANDHLLDIQSATAAASESNVQNILNKYQSRNVATDYVERLPLWTRQIQDSDDGDTNHESNESSTSDFEFDLTVVIPKMQSIIYVPTLSEVLTEAWMRYLSLLVITGCLVQSLFMFVFSNQIVKSHVSVR